VTASPGQLPAPIVSETADKDFNQRMRNMTIAHESTPPALSPHPYDYNTPQYSPYTLTHQGQHESQPNYPAYNRYPSQPGYQPTYLEPSSSDFSIATMHGMPGYPGQPPIARSMQSVSPQYSSQASITPRPYGWGSPPMSPSMSTVPFGAHFDGPNNYQGRGGYESRGYGQDGRDEYGHMRAYPPHGQWVGPSSPYNYYPPYQQQQHPPPPPRDYHPNRPGPPPQGYPQNRGAWTEHRPPAAQPNRMSWSGQIGGGDHKDRERKAYHPQPPARRSDWVMWVGNV
jgi:hypothetical protein